MAAIQPRSHCRRCESARGRNERPGRFRFSFLQRLMEFMPTRRSCQHGALAHLRCACCSERAHLKCRARRTGRLSAWSASRMRPEGDRRRSKDRTRRFEGRTRSFGDSWTRRSGWHSQTRTSETRGRTSVRVRPLAESAALAVPQLTGCPGLLSRLLAPLCRTLDGRLRCRREARPEVAGPAASFTQARARKWSCCRPRRLISSN